MNKPVTLGFVEIAHVGGRCDDRSINLLAPLSPILAGRVTRHTASTGFDGRAPFAMRVEAIGFALSLEAPYTPRTPSSHQHEAVTIESNFELCFARGRDDRDMVRVCERLKNFREGLLHLKRPVTVEEGEAFALELRAHYEGGFDPGLPPWTFRVVLFGKRLADA